MSVESLLEAARRARDPYMQRVLLHKAALIPLRDEAMDPSSPPHSWGGGPPWLSSSNAIEHRNGAVEGSLPSYPNRSLIPHIAILIIIAALLAASPAWLWAL